MSQPRTKLDFALHYARMGIRVFPVVEGTKKPAVDDWPNLATTDEKQVRTWWREGTHNIGIATGKGIVAVDADVKDGKPGLDSLADLMLDVLPDSFLTATPSGGRHLLLRTDREIANRANSIDGFPGIDIRGENGYVLGAGSVLPNGEYSVLANGGIAEMPSEFLEILGKRPRHQAKTDAPVIELDLPANIEKAIRWLNMAPVAIEGEGGDELTYKTAARMRDFGLSEGMALEVLGPWADMCEPPWPAEDLAIKVANAFAYASGTWGGKTPHADFEPVDIGDNSQEAPTAEEIARVGAVPAEVKKAADDKGRRAKFKVIGPTASRELLRSTVIRPLVKGVINQNGFAVAYGAPKTAKTFNIVDMCTCIAAGIPWAGKYETTKGAVLYVAGEGGLGIHARREAAFAKYGVPEDTPFYLMPATLDLVSNHEDAKEIVKIAKRIPNLSVIVIDTLSRAFVGDENSSEPMMAFVANVDLIRAETGAAAIVVHHSGKDPTKGMMGSQKLLGGVDTVIKVETTERGKGMLKTEWQRDLEQIDLLAEYELVPTEAGTDAEGNPWKTAVLEYGSAASEFEDDMPEDEGELSDRDLFARAIMDAADDASAEGKSTNFTRQDAQNMFNRALVAVHGEGARQPLGARMANKWLDSLVKEKRLRVSKKGPTNRRTYSPTWT
jgi:hypothetical protein